MSGQIKETPASRIIQDIGASVIARELGIANSAITGWKKRGKIPQKHWDAIIKIAASLPGRRSFALTYEDFMTLPDDSEVPA